MTSSLRPQTGDIRATQGRDGWGSPTQGLSRGVVWQTAVILNDCVARIMQACHSGLDSDEWGSSHDIYLIRTSLDSRALKWR